MFPFYWVGAAFAAGFLVAAGCVFVVLAKVLSVPEGGQSSIVPGLIAGIRDWSAHAGTTLRRVESSSGADEPAGAAEAAPTAPTEPVRGHLR